jgi:hypothetical protein
MGKHFGHKLIVQDNVYIANPHLAMAVTVGRSLLSCDQGLIKKSKGKDLDKTEIDSSVFEVNVVRILLKNAYDMFHFSQ